MSRGEADAGFVYRMDAVIESRIEIVEAIPESRHNPVRYPAAAVKSGGNAEGARKFVAFLRSEEARRIFRKYGFE